MSGNEDFDLIATLATQLSKANAAAGAATGGCSFVGPGGRLYCVDCTPQQCSALNGNYFEGSCP